MKVFGLEILKGGEVSAIQKSYSEIKKKLKEYEQLRPGVGEFPGINVSQDGVQIPRYFIDEPDIYQLALDSDILRTVIVTIRDGVFRRGIEVKEIKENPVQLQLINNIKKKINSNNQTIFDVLKRFEFDLGAIDDGYLIRIFDYYFDGEGEVMMKEPKEIIRASPLKMRLIADYAGRRGHTDEGKKVYVSLTNRHVLIKEDQAKQNGFKDDKGRKLHLACYRGEVGRDGKFIYYTGDEVLHLSKYNPTMLYGYPNTLSIYMKIITLMQMDRFLMTNYQRGRSPRGFLAIRGTNFESLKAAWETLKEETRKDPHSINPMLIQDDKGRGSIAEFVDLMKPLTEMQYIESRNEMRRQIGALYGVMPLFSGDIQTSGGLNNESMQMSVTNRALEESQKLYNEKVFPWILEFFGITDYQIVLAEPEERDEIEDVKRVAFKVDNAMKMSQMGFDVTWNAEEEMFEFSDKPTKEPLDLSASFLPGQNQQSDFAGTPTKSIASGTYTPNVNDFLEIDDIINLSDISIGHELDDFLDASEVINKGYLREKVSKASEVVMNQIKKEIGKFEIKKQGEDFITFITSALWAKQFENLTKVQSNNVKDVLVDSIIKNATLGETIKKIQGLGINKDQAEVIVQTEQQALQNSIREYNFNNIEGSEDFVYKWIGPQDVRTSDICEAIKKRSLKGVSLSELRKMVKQESIRGGSDGSREWTPHVNCRHTFVKVIK